MEVVPAIDISKGRCVRLFKGKKGTEKVYFENPIDALKFWMDKGVNRLHFVDLDGAWGLQDNKELLKKMIMIAADKVKIQIGGGIRSIEAAIDLINLGADRIIIGTLAVKEPEVISELSKKIGSERLIIALDYRKGRLTTQGWTEDTSIDPFSFAIEVSKKGAGYILFSSVEADGAFTGPDFESIKKMVQKVNIPVYAAGGVRNIEDIKKLSDLGVYGVIVGKAFYERKLPFNIFKIFN